MSGALPNNLAPRNTLDRRHTLMLLSPTMAVRVAVRQLDVHLRWLERLGADPHGVAALRDMGPHALRWLGSSEGAARERLEALLPPLVWDDGLGELALWPATARLRLVPGWLAAELDVACDETGPATARVVVALGREGRGDGAEASATLDPRTPALLVDRWGEALIAAVWEAVLDVLEGATLQTGELSGARLVLSGFFADDGELAVEVG